MKPNLVRHFLLAVLLIIIVSIGSGSRPVRGEQPWPELSLVDLASGLNRPTHITHAGDDSHRLFIVEQAGKIRIYQNGLLPTPFLDISGRVLSPSNGGGNEEGLLSVVFPPGYGAKKNHFYVYYTRLDGENQLSRFYLSNDDDLADPDSEEDILLIPHPSRSNHNGGQLAFGPDGYLYIGTGDGGGGYDPEDNAQDLNSLLGKLLRIHVEFITPNEITDAVITYLPVIFTGDSPVAAPQYRIPPDNPFNDSANARDEIWALGLRNPWRFSFDRAVGDLFIGDVGQSSWEEIDYQPFGSKGGENYGWDIFEGNLCLQDECGQNGLTFPVYAYPHPEDNGSASVTGGFVYRGVDYPAMEGIYIFADFFSNKLHGLRLEGNSWQSHEFNAGYRFITSFGEDETGELYFVSLDGGKLFKITSTP